MYVLAYRRVSSAERNFSELSQPLATVIQARKNVASALRVGASLALVRRIVKSRPQEITLDAGR